MLGNKQVRERGECDGQQGRGNDGVPHAGREADMLSEESVQTQCFPMSPAEP